MRQRPQQPCSAPFLPNNAVRRPCSAEMDDLPILAFAPAQTVKLGRNGVKNAEFPVPLDPGGRLPSSNGLDHLHALLCQLSDGYPCVT
jgi:hypothetical protein